MFFFRFLDNIVLQRLAEMLDNEIRRGSKSDMSHDHILRKRIECNLELDHVSKGNWHKCKANPGSRESR